MRSTARPSVLRSTCDCRKPHLYASHLHAGYELELQSGARAEVGADSYGGAAVEDIIIDPGYSSPYLSLSV